MIEEKYGVSHRKISHATSAELRLSTFFCNINVIVWQNLMQNDKEKALVSSEIWLGGYFGGFKDVLEYSCSVSEGFQGFLSLIFS